jgi:hypothetical protein
MNRKLSDQQIAATFRELMAAGGPVSGRSLRTALRDRFGGPGKTERVFALCRALKTPLNAEPAIVQRLQEQVAAAESERDLALARAELAEQREIAHQDRWANEIHTLRQTAEQLKGEAARRRALESQMLLLNRELQALRARLVSSRTLPPSGGD